MEVIYNFFRDICPTVIALLAIYVSNKQAKTDADERMRLQNESVIENRKLEQVIMISNIALNKLEELVNQLNNIRNELYYYERNIKSLIIDFEKKDEFDYQVDEIVSLSQKMLDSIPYKIMNWMFLSKTTEKLVELYTHDEVVENRIKSWEDNIFESYQWCKKKFMRITNGENNVAFKEEFIDKFKVIESEIISLNKLVQQQVEYAAESCEKILLKYY